MLSFYVYTIYAVYYILQSRISNLFFNLSWNWTHCRLQCPLWHFVILPHLIQWLALQIIKIVLNQITINLLGCMKSIEGGSDKTKISNVQNQCAYRPTFSVPWIYGRHTEEATATKEKRRRSVKKKTGIHQLFCLLFDSVFVRFKEIYYQFQKAMEKKPLSTSWSE